MGDFIEKQPLNKKSSSPKTVTAIVLGIVLVVGLLLGSLLYLINDGKRDVSAQVLRLIENKGVDAISSSGLDINEDTDVEKIVQTLLSADRYSRYYTKEDYEQYRRETSGQYSGIGISVNSQRIIENVLGNSPAMLAGIKVGDKLVAGKNLKDNGDVDLVQVTDYTSFESREDADKFLSMVALGDTIALKIERNGEESPIFVKLKKQDYVMSYVAYADNQVRIQFLKEGDNNFVDKNQRIENLSDDTAYISLSAFRGDATEQLANALEYAKMQNRRKIIFDLRGNGGGSLSVMTEIASYLIYNNGKGNTIVGFEQSKGVYEGVVRVSHTGLVAGKNKYDKENIDKIVVLADNNTASASECLLSAMLYYDASNDLFTKAGNLVLTNGKMGGRTYGKGKMQTIYPLVNGGALKLTTANLLTPFFADEGEYDSIDKKGIDTVQENCMENDNLALLRAIELING